MSLQAVKNYFGSDGHRELKNSELLEFKKEDPEGYEKVRDGIMDGTFTYK
jgi:hypothetical protein